MKVITLNVNGVRAAARKGFFDWLASQQADVICLQETKAHETQLTDPVFHPEGYHCYYYDAEKKGYSGVALFCRQQPLAVTRGLGWPCADQEGRYIQADFADVSVASLYLPSGTSGDERQTLKYDFLDRFTPYLQTLKQSRPNLILCGDWNIAHKTIDLKNWRANQKHSGFLPEERAWMDKLFDSLGFVDAFRVINPQPDQYTWWSNRGQAWAKNVGWRIDYQIITPGLADKVERAEIYKEQRFSDHAPLTIEYA
jgi:exodeoxyribonuclease-3